MAEHAEVPPEIVARLRAVCLALPEAYEEPAWVGTRWCVRKRNFAHVVAVSRPEQYEAVRTESDPDGLLLAFLQATYDAAADLAAEDRGSLERA